MTVLMPDRRLGVRRRAASAPDAHGDVYAASWGAMVGPWPGRAAEGPDVPVGQAGGRPWVIALDPAAWPVYQGDMVVQVDDGATVEEWLVNSADLLTNNADPSVNYIRVEAHVRAGTTPGSTRP